MGASRITLGIENSSSMAWSASQRFRDELAAQLSRDAQQHLYFVIVGPALTPTALRSLPDSAGWELDINFQASTGQETLSVPVPKDALPGMELSFSDAEGGLALAPSADAGELRKVTVAEVVRAAIHAQEDRTVTMPQKTFTGRELFFDVENEVLSLAPAVVDGQPQKTSGGGVEQAADSGQQENQDWVEVALNAFFNFEIAYIGQSYGKDGSSKAIDRLTGGHKTVERKLSEVHDYSRTRSVGFITIDQQEKFIGATIPTDAHGADAPATKQFVEAAKQFFGIDKGPLSKVTVDAAEAALITAFKPACNDLLKDFTQREAPKLLSQLKDQGYTHLEVRIDLGDALAKVKAPGTDEPSSRHRWRFNLGTGALEGTGRAWWW